jgi:hypothetical protein
LLRHIAEKLVLMFAVLGSGVQYVINDLFTIHTKAFGDLLDSLRTKRAFGI